MVSPFEVYLVMQLDSIGGALSFLAAASILASGGCLVAWWFNSGIDEENAEAGRKALLRLAPISCLLLLIASLIPSTKTAAAMILLPALTSDAVTEPLTREAGELYDIAKGALRNMAEREPEPKPEG